jgi:hypothetical protein
MVSHAKEINVLMSKGLKKSLRLACIIASFFIVAAAVRA